MTVDPLALFAPSTAKPAAAPKPARAERDTRAAEGGARDFDRALQEKDAAARKVDTKPKRATPEPEAKTEDRAVDPADVPTDAAVAVDLSPMVEARANAFAAPEGAELHGDLAAAVPEGELDAVVETESYLPSHVRSAAMQAELQPAASEGADAPLTKTPRAEELRVPVAAAAAPQNQASNQAELVHLAGEAAREPSLDEDEAAVPLGAVEVAAEPSVDASSDVSAATSGARSLAAAARERADQEADGARSEGSSVAALSRPIAAARPPVVGPTASPAAEAQSENAVPTDMVADEALSREAPRFEALLSGLETARGDARAEAVVAAKPEAAQNAATAQPLVRNVLSRLEEIELAEGKTRVLLRPQGLGTIEIDILRQADGRMQLVMRVENPLILEALRQDEAQLNRFMGEQGFDLANGGAEFAAYDHGAAQDQREGLAASAAEGGLAEAAVSDTAALRADVGVISASELNILT